MQSSTYNKNDVCPFPPMGWNSYDYYNTMVTEEQIRKNAEFVSKNLLSHGFEYIVIDIQWSDSNSGAMNDQNIQYIPFSRFCIDEFSRQIPSESRFPSSKNNNGFKSLADYIHSLGLKFGIHIMRGIPRFACHEHLPIKTHDGTKITCDQVANPYSVSKWNPDMYGLDYNKPYAQDYYDSIFELYATWGVDFVKVDDICNTNMYPTNPYSAEKEIQMISTAIKNSGRPMVLSLSPGPAIIEKAHHLKKYANMWRITDDFWDNFDSLKAMFERCEVWQTHTGGGNWPDCDMIPLSPLSWGWGHGERNSNFTLEETKIMLSLWSIFRSPLMLGTDLPKIDKKTLKLIQNDDILQMNKCKNQAEQVTDSAKSDVVIWKNKIDDASFYIVYFNLSKQTQKIPLNYNNKNIKDLWEQKEVKNLKELKLKPHTCKAYKIY